MAAFSAVVTEDGGRLVFDKPSEFRAYVKKFAADEVVVTVKRLPRAQGTQAMRYLRGVGIPDIEEACGYLDPDDYESVFEGLAWKFLRLPDGPFGEPKRESTAKGAMSAERMAEFIDKVITYAETTIPGCQIRRSEDVDMDRVVDPGWS